METNQQFWRRSEPWEHDFILSKLKKEAIFKGGYIFLGFTIFFIIGLISSIIDRAEARQIALYGILAFAMSLFSIAIFAAALDMKRRLRNKDYFVQEIIVTRKNNSAGSPFITVAAENGETTTINVTYQFLKNTFTGARGMLVALPDKRTQAFTPHSFYFFEEGKYAYEKEMGRRYSASSELSERRNPSYSSDLSETGAYSFSSERPATRTPSTGFATPSLSEHETLLPALKKASFPWIFLALIPLFLGNALGVSYILFVKPKDLLFLMVLAVCLSDLAAILPFRMTRNTRSAGSLGCPLLIFIGGFFGELFVGTTPLMKNKELSSRVTLTILIGYVVVTVLYIVALLFISQKNRRLSLAAKNRDYEIQSGNVCEISKERFGSGRSTYVLHFLHIQSRDGKIYRIISTRAKARQMIVGTQGTLVRVRRVDDPSQEPEYYFIT